MFSIRIAAILNLITVLFILYPSARAQNLVTIDLSNPQIYNNYPPQFGQTDLGTYTGPYATPSTGRAWSIWARGGCKFYPTSLYCNSFQPASTGAEGVVLFSGGSTINSVSLNVFNPYTFDKGFYLDVFCLSSITHSTFSCNSYCTITGVSHRGTYFNNYNLIGNRNTVSVQCSFPIERVQYLSDDVYGFRDLVESMTVDSGPANNNSVNLNISQLRIGQTVFEPSSTNGATTDLVTKKPYAVEVTLSGSVPSQYSNLLARADLYVNGVFYLSSATFRVGDIVNGLSKAFIFGQENIAGAKSLRVDVVPVNPQAGVFDTTATISRNVNFYDTSLSLLVNQITGCLPTVSNCFAAPTVQNISVFNTQQVPLAQKFLPISGGQLQVTFGINWAFSDPDPNFSEQGIYKDTAFLWLQKKLALKDLGVALVGDDYFAKHGAELPGYQTLGLVLLQQRGVALVSGKNETTLAHELIHNFQLGLGVVGDHSNITFVESVGSDANEIWTAGIPLDPFIALDSLANNIFADTAVQAPPYGIGETEYNVAFQAIKTGQIDPKVVLVTGILGPNGENIDFQAQRADAVLDSAPSSPNLVIQGLNASNVVVSSVPSIENNQIELLKEDGSSSVMQTNSSFFTATLPDDGTIQNIRVIKGSQVLYTQPVDKINLDKAIKGLYLNSFNVKESLAKTALKIIKRSYSGYLEAMQKHQSKAARARLRTVREKVIDTCKDQIPLEDGSSISKNALVGLIDAELNLAK